MPLSEAIQAVLKLQEGPQTAETITQITALLSDGFEAQAGLVDKAITLCMELITTPPALYVRGDVPESVPVEQAVQLAQFTLRVALLAVSEIMLKGDFTRLEALKDGIVVPKLTDAGVEAMDWLRLFTQEPAGQA